MSRARAREAFSASSFRFSTPPRFYTPWMDSLPCSRIPQPRIEGLGSVQRLLIPPGVSAKLRELRVEIFGEWSGASWMVLEACWTEQAICSSPWRRNRAPLRLSQRRSSANAPARRCEQDVRQFELRPPVAATTCR
jgi:hypothetical protein